MAEKLERTDIAQSGHDAALSHHHRSILGAASCDTCGDEWPCHLSAWGNPNHVSRCNVRNCDGAVRWSPE